MIVARLIEAHNLAALSASALGILGMIPMFRYFEPSFDQSTADFARFVSNWPELNRTLFWAEVACVRSGINRADGQHIVDFRWARTFNSCWKVSAEDFEYFCTEMALLHKPSFAPM